MMANDSGSKYLYDNFEFTDEYRERVIEVVRRHSNIEIGGYRIFDGTGTHYMQNPVEITDFIFSLKKFEMDHGVKLTSFLEIGFSAGINNTFINKFFNFENIVSVDIMSPSHLCSDTLVANLRFKPLTLICGDSTSQSTIEKVRMHGPYDLIFIDGGHDYDIVARDFRNYSGFVRNKGIIAFHDIFTKNIPGPGKVWGEVKKELVNDPQWEIEELYDKGQHTSYGIGVLRKVRSS